VKLSKSNTHILISQYGKSISYERNSNKVSKKVKVAIAGVGNCASALLQGISFMVIVTLMKIRR
jgi:hypothetical protein